MISANEMDQPISTPVGPLPPPAYTSTPEQKASLAMRRAHSHGLAPTAPISVPQHNGNSKQNSNAALGGMFAHPFSAAVASSDSTSGANAVLLSGVPPCVTPSGDPSSNRARQRSLSASAPTFTPSSATFPAPAAPPPPPFVSNVFSYGRPPPVSPFGMVEPGQEYFAPALMPPGFVPHGQLPRSLAPGGLPPVDEHRLEPSNYAPPTAVAPYGLPAPYRVSPSTPNCGHGLPSPDRMRRPSLMGVASASTSTPIFQQANHTAHDTDASDSCPRSESIAALGNLAGLAMSRHAQGSSANSANKALPTPSLVPPPSRMNFGNAHSPTVSISPSPKSQHRSPNGSSSHSPLSGGSPVMNPNPNGVPAQPWVPGYQNAPGLVAPFSQGYPPPQPQMAGMPPRFQPPAQHTRRVSTPVPIVPPAPPPTRRGSLSTNNGTIASAAGGGKGGRIAHQPLKTTGHNSKPSVQMDPASFAFMLASQMAPSKKEERSTLKLGPRSGGDAVAAPPGLAQSAKKLVLVRLPSEVHWPENNGTHPFLPVALQEEAMALEAEVGDDLNNDLADELAPSDFESDHGDGDEEGGESEDPPSSSELDSPHSSTNSHRSLLVTSSAVEREEKKVRLLSLRAIDHRRALWRARIPGPELTAILPALPPLEKSGSDASAVYPWMNSRLEPISRLPHLDERHPTMLPDALAVAMPLPPYRAWNGYVHWRLEERDRAEQEAAWDQHAQCKQRQLQYQLSPNAVNYALAAVGDDSSSLAAHDVVPKEVQATITQEIDIEAKAADLDIASCVHAAEGQKLPVKALNSHEKCAEREASAESHKTADLKHKGKTVKAPEGKDSEDFKPDESSITDKPTITLSPRGFLHSPLPMPQLSDLDLVPSLLKDMSADVKSNRLTEEMRHSSPAEFLFPQRPTSRASLPWQLPGSDELPDSPTKPSSTLPQITVLDEGRSSRSSHSIRSRNVRNKREPQYSLDLSSSGGPFGKEIFAALGLPSLSDFGGSDDEDARTRNFRSAPPYSSAPTPKLEHGSPPPPERETKSDSAAPPPAEEFKVHPPSPASTLDSPVSPNETRTASKGPWRPAEQALGQDLEKAGAVDRVPTPMPQQALEPETLLAQHVYPSDDDVPEELLTNPSEDADASEEDNSPYRPPHRLAGVPRLSAFGSLPLPNTLSPVLQPTVLEEYSDLDMEPSSPTNHLHHDSDKDFRELHETELSRTRSPTTPPRPAHQRTLTCETLPSSSIGEGARTMLDNPLMETPPVSRRASLLLPGRSASLSGTSSLPHMSGVGSSGEHAALTLHLPEKEDIISNPSDEGDGYGTFGEEDEDCGKDGVPVDHTSMHHRSRPSFLETTEPPWSFLHRGRPHRVPYMPLHPCLNQRTGSPEGHPSRHDRSTSFPKEAGRAASQEGHPDMGSGIPSIARDQRVLNAAAPVFQPGTRTSVSHSGERLAAMPRSASAPMDETRHSGPSLPSQDFEPPMAKPITIRRPSDAGHQSKMTVANVLAHMRNVEEDIVPGRPPQDESPVVPPAMSKLEHVHILSDTESELNSEHSSAPSAQGSPSLDVPFANEKKLAPADASDLGLPVSASSMGADTVRYALVSPAAEQISGGRSWIGEASVRSHASVNSRGDVSKASDTVHEMDKSEEDLVDELARRLEASVDTWVDKLVREMHSAMSPGSVRWPSGREIPSEDNRVVEPGLDLPPSWTDSSPANKDATPATPLPTDKPLHHGDLHEQGELDFEVVQSILERSLGAFKTALQTAVPGVARPLLDDSAAEEMLVPRLSSECLGRVASTIGFRVRGSLNNGIAAIQGSLMGPPPEGSSLDLSIKRMRRATDALDRFLSLQQNVDEVGMYVRTRMDRLVHHIQQGQDTFVGELEMAVVRGIIPQLERIKEDDLDPDMISGILVTNVVQIVEEYSRYEDEAERTADLVSDLIRPMVSSLIQDFLGDVREQTESVLSDWVEHANKHLETLYSQHRKTQSRNVAAAALPAQTSSSGSTTKATGAAVSAEEISQAFRMLLQDYETDLEPAIALLEPLGIKQGKTNAEVQEFLHKHGETLDTVRAVPGLARSTSEQLVAATLESKDAYGAILARMNTLATVDANMVSRTSDLEEAKTVLEAKVEALHRELQERETECHSAEVGVESQRDYVESLEKELKSVRVRLAEREEALLQAQQEVNCQRDRAMEAREAQNEARREAEKAHLAQLAAENRIRKLDDAHQDAKDRIQDSLVERDVNRAALLAEREAHSAQANAQQHRLEAAEHAVTSARKQVDLLAIRLLDVQSSADTRVTEQSKIAARAVGEQTELRVRVADQDERLTELVDLLAAQKDTLARKETQLSDASRRAANADKTTRMLRMAEATIATLHKRIEVIEESHVELKAAQEAEKAIRLEFEEYRSHFDAMEEEVTQLKSTFVERSRLEEAQALAEASRKENEELRRRIAELESQKASEASIPPTAPPKVVRFAPGHTPIPSTPRLAPAPPSMPPTPRPHTQRPARISSFDWPALGEKSHPAVNVDKDGWWC